MTVKEFLIKRRLIHILTNRSRRNYVSIYFDDNDVIIAKTGRWRNEYFGVNLPAQDLELMASYIRDGSFLIYAGSVQTPLLRFVLDNKRKWRKLVRWTKRG